MGTTAGAAPLEDALTGIASRAAGLRHPGRRGARGVHCDGHMVIASERAKSAWRPEVKLGFPSPPCCSPKHRRPGVRGCCGGERQPRRRGRRLVNVAPVEPFAADRLQAGEIARPRGGHPSKATAPPGDGCASVDRDGPGGVDG